MVRLDDLTRGASLRGILPDSQVTIVEVIWSGSDAITLTDTDALGHPGTRLLSRDDDPVLERVVAGPPWSFDSDGHRFRLVSEAHRIRLANLLTRSWPCIPRSAIPSSVRIKHMLCDHQRPFIRSFDRVRRNRDDDHDR